MDEAVFAFRKVLEVNPKSAQAYNSLGTVLAAQDKTADAISAFRKAADAYNSLGLARVNQGKTEDAIANYQKALTINPKYAEAIITWGLLSRHRGGPRSLSPSTRKLS